MQKNDDYLVTVKVTFTKRYLVNAADYERAEDYAIEEAYGDVYSIGEDGCDVDIYDTERL